MTICDCECGCMRTNDMEDMIVEKNKRICDSCANFEHVIGNGIARCPKCGKKDREFLPNTRMDKDYVEISFIRIYNIRKALKCTNCFRLQNLSMLSLVN
ncbi:hypothetical protein [Nitrosarchaeum sp. AC2]|uniref:hypothetical protein n=1 Tax=Nitrosarchaeum sp. AC2 TaxID=2259673 RepID=UPI0015CE60AD|nr:hypothetical protein [Nitrosarchaeum sp. AC2]